MRSTTSFTTTTTRVYTTTSATPSDLPPTTLRTTSKLKTTTKRFDINTYTSTSHFPPNMTNTKKYRPLPTFIYPTNMPIQPNFKAIKQEEIECTCTSSYIEMGFACEIPILKKCTSCFPQLTCKTRSIHGVSKIFKYILTIL